MNHIENGIVALDNRVDQLENNSSNSTGTSVTSNLPNYWKTRLDKIGEKIKALQMENGMDTLQFLWCSDIHGVPGALPSNTNYIGDIGRYLMDKHNIPFFVVSGDIMSQSSHSNTDSIWNEYDKLSAMLSPINNEEFLAIRGNHDGVWGSKMEYNGNADQYYHSYIGDKALFNAFMRRQTLDRYKRVFGKDGMYFYVDYHNYRIYLLNGHTFGDNSVNTQGQAVYNGFKHPILGSEQIQWVADTLNTVAENQQVLFVCHAQLNQQLDFEVFRTMLTHYIARTSGSKSVAISQTYWGTNPKYANTEATFDFTNAKGSIVGWFNGHIHTDSIKNKAILFNNLPVFTITTAGGDVRDSYYKDGTLTRTKGTANETAIDLVTITSDYVYFTRIGCGYDRKYNRVTDEVTIDYDSLFIPEQEPDTPTKPDTPTEPDTPTGNLFDINGDGYEAWNGSKMYTNWMHYTAAEVGSKLSTVYHIKGGTPYKFQFKYTGGTTTTSIYCTNANSLANVTSDYNDKVILFQHDFLDGYANGFMIRFEFRVDCANNLIIQADEPIEDDGLTQGEITSEVTWTADTRLSSSSGNYSTQTGIYASSDIKVKNGDVIRIYGASDWLTYGYICAYSDSSYLSHIDMYGGTELSTNYFKAVRDSEQILTITILYSSVTYIRVCNKALDPLTVRVSRNMELDKNNMDNGDNSELTQGEITSEVTWEKDKRLSSTSGSYSDLTGSYASSDIPCKNGDIIRLYNVSKGTNHNYVTAYGTSYLGFIELEYDGNTYSNTYMTATRVDGVTTITILHDSVEYIRVCSNGGIDPLTVRISRNKELNKNYFDVNGEGYVAWNGSKMYTNYIHYKCAEVGSKLSPIYHIKGGTPYKFRIIYPDKSTMTDLVYVINANGQANVTAAYDSEVKLLQHDMSDGYVVGDWFIQFEFRTDCASDLIIQIDENIVD